MNLKYMLHRRFLDSVIKVKYLVSARSGIIIRHCCIAAATAEFSATHTDTHNTQPASEGVEENKSQHLIQTRILELTKKCSPAIAQHRG